jgi:protein phosphatase slingshot
MDYVGSFAKYINRTRVCQWSINKFRSTVYPMWRKNMWEANRILDDDNVWLGDMDSACDREAMRSLGITRVICAVYDMDPLFPDDPDLIYLKVPVIDKPTADIAKHFDKAIDFIDESVKNRKGVLIHCVYGVSRSSTLVCAYLIKKHGMSVSSAIKHVKARRPHANPNSGFLLQLQAMPVEQHDPYGFLPPEIRDLHFN